MYRRRYNREQAIEAANEFIKKVNKLEEEYALTFNTDHEIYLTYKKQEPGSESHWGYINLGWDGDGSGIKVTDVYKDAYTLRREEALSKLTEEDKQILGIKD